MKPTIPSDENRELVRSLAHQRVTQLHEIWKMHLDEHFHLFRWMVATLMLANSGGAISIFGAPGIETWLRVSAGGVFALGVIASIIHALRSQTANEDKMKRLQRRIAQWLEVEQSGGFEGDLETTMVQEMDEMFTWPIALHLFGWLPGLMFAAGVGLVAIGAALGALQ
jgi:uncharacterized membrane protein YqaE (UPF0057 family)